MQKEPDISITSKEHNKRDLFDGPINENIGALKTAYLARLTELITGQLVPELSTDDEPDRTFEWAHHYSQNKEVSDYFAHLMKDKMVLDLGCGVQATGYRIACFSKAKEYIGVEKHFGKTAFDRTSLLARSDSVPFEIIQQDMIEYVQDRSHRADIILLAGIDLIIVPEHQWQRLLYGIHQMISEEGRLCIAGGGAKPWNMIEKYFMRDTELEEIQSQSPELLSTVLPSIWKKR